MKMNTIRRLFASCLIAFSCLSPLAEATSFSTDQSDLWWNSGESGWGIQLVQRGSVIFATMFVYDQSNIAYWYSATLNSAGTLVWSGDLVATNGPWFGAVPFNPSIVTRSSVGTMTWTAQTVTTGILTYNVGGVAVTKNLARQPIAVDDFSGHYSGGIHQETTGCNDPSFNGISEVTGVLNVTQDGSSFTLQSLPFTGGSCSYQGTLTEAGQMGDVVGSFQCSDGTSGTFHLFEMQVNMTGLTGKLAASNLNPTGCQDVGWFGGILVTTF